MEQSVKSYASSLIALAIGLLLIRRLLRRFFAPVEFPGPGTTSSYVYGRKGNEDKMPPVFPNGWYPLKLSGDVPIGKVVSVQALGENFVIFRGENGVASVADAWCPHLGANLGGGSVVGNCVRCPFHHWTFDGKDGECTSVPYADKIPSVAKLKIWKSMELNECIYVWYHADNEEPTWIPTSCKEIANKEVSLLTVQHQYLRAHVQDIYENLADFAHFIYLHGPGPLGGTKPGFYDSLLSKFMWLQYDEIDWKASEEESTKHESYLNIRDRLTFFNFFNLPLTFKLRTIGTGYGFAIMDIPVFGKLVLEFLYVPLEPLKVSSLVRIYARPGLLTTLFIPLIKRNLDTMLMRDSEVWKDKCYLDKPVLAKGERISQFRRWYSQFYSKSSPKLTKWTNFSDW